MSLRTPTSPPDDARPAEPLCRTRRQQLGLPYAKSNCYKCGTVIRPGWRCAEGLSPADPVTDPPAEPLRIKLVVETDVLGGTISKTVTISPEMWFKHKADSASIVVREIDSMIEQNRQVALALVKERKNNT